MKIEYDREADAMYIYFCNVKPVDNKDIEEGVTVDLDKEGHIIGIEILDVSKRFPTNEFSKVSIENLLPVAA